MVQNSGFSIRRTSFFFHQKCSLEHIGILEGKKIKRKLFPKSGWVSMDSPIRVPKMVQNSGFSIRRT